MKVRGNQSKEDGQPNDLTPVSAILPTIINSKHKPLTPIQARLLSMPTPTDDEKLSIVYQHSVLCQTCIPYRDPGATRIWQRRNGKIRLELLAGRVLDPNLDEVVDVGLPFGPKPRLVLFHLNAEALRTGSPLINLDDSLTAFVKCTLKLDVDGRTIRSVKEQLNRLSAADFRFYSSYEGHAITVKGTLIEGLDLWVSKDERQRVLWPSYVQFSQRYFDSLLQHAVPLNEEAIKRLSHSAMGLDVYTWLAQRLHRVRPSKSDFVPWTSLKEQFGPDYGRIGDFRRVFARTLAQVKAVYQDARFGLDEKGMRLHNSAPPVARRLFLNP
jgi:hypothetical protein